MICREWVLVKVLDQVLTAEPLKCKCWHCEYCQPIRCSQLKHLATMGQPDTFLTLTVNPERGIDADERARDLARAWRSLRLRAMRRYGYRSLPFLAVFERTKNNEPHLHILLRCKWLDQKWLSRQMLHLIDAPIVDIRRASTKSKVCHYIAKYVGKEPSSFKGTKRYWTSRDYELPDPREEEAPPWDDVLFKVEKMPLASFLESARLTGFVVYKVAREVHFLHYDYRDARQIGRPPVVSAR